MKNVVQIPPWRETIRERLPLTLIFSILGLAVALSLGVVMGAFNPVYGAAVAGAIAMVIIVLFRLDELTVSLVIAIHLFIDWYLALHLVAILMALLLLFVYYIWRSANRPWVEPRPLWLWILFLVLTIYPAIYGGQFMLWDAATYYPSVVLGAFLMFWLGSIIAKDISALRRVFQLLAALAALIAIHTIIQTATGIFLFSTAHEDIHLVTASNLNIYGTNAVRSASFFIDPNWNGCFLATMFFLSLGLLIESKSFLGKFVFLAEMAVILVALLFTYSNGSWVALLGGTVIFMFWVGSQHYRLLLISIIALTAILTIVLFPSQITVELQHASAPQELLLRGGAWQTGIQVMKAFPLFGVGLGSQAYLVRADPYRVSAQYVPLPQPHNAYIQWGSMAGVPVLVVFILLLGYAFWLSWCNWRAIDTCYRPLLGGAITALIALSINSWSIDGWTHPVIAMIGWLIFGLLTSPLLLRHSHGSKRQERQLNIVKETKA